MLAAEDSERDRTGQTKGTSDGPDRCSYFDSIAIPPIDRHEILCIDFQKGQIGGLIHPDDFGGQHSLVSKVDGDVYAAV